MSTCCGFSELYPGHLQEQCRLLTTEPFHWLWYPGLVSHGKGLHQGCTGRNNRDSLGNGKYFQKWDRVSEPREGIHSNGWAASSLTLHGYIAPTTPIFVYQGPFLWMLCLVCHTGVGRGSPMPFSARWFLLDSAFLSLLSSRGTCSGSGSSSETEVTKTGSLGSASILAATEMGRGKLWGIRFLTI